MNIRLHVMDTSFHSYQHLAAFAQQIQSISGELHITFSGWFAANMSAALGAILYEFRSRGGVVNFTNPDDIFRRNGFLSHFGHPAVQDYRNTTIQYQELKVSDSRRFHDFIRTSLLDHPQLPHLSDGLKRKIQEAIFEIFVNAQTHSGQSCIFTCGQFFPQKHKIEFTITDMGVGFGANFSSRFNRNVPPERAIEWAMIEGNTTKTDAPGGIGLAILKEFTVKNNGKIQIISNTGFYQLDAGGIHLNSLSTAFPGTIVNVQFRTDDANSYVLASEMSTDDIF